MENNSTVFTEGYTKNVARDFCCFGAVNLAGGLGVPAMLGLCCAQFRAPDATQGSSILSAPVGCIPGMKLLDFCHHSPAQIHLAGRKRGCQITPV